MKKALITLSGSNHPKELFKKYLMDDWWVWTVSPYAHMRHNSVALGWNYDDTETSDPFNQKMYELANKEIDYEFSHIAKFIARVHKSDKALTNGKIGDVLIAKGISRDTILRLQDYYDFFLIKVSMNNIQPKHNCDGDGVFEISLGGGDETKKAIADVMRYISYDISEKELV